jgi:hypothetical protein
VPVSAGASRQLRLLAVAVPIVVAGVVLAFHGRLPQDPRYHRFADTRALSAIPNAGDVLSNAALVAAGALGLLFLASSANRRRPREPRQSVAYGVFFAGVFLAGFGSAYYHWAPDNQRLFWDRLPMTLAFTSLFVAVLGERVGPRLASRLLVPLLAIGAAAVFYWRWTEAAGHGDLRLYALVQYGLVVSMGLLLLLFPDRRTDGFWWVAGAYALAKVCEVFDEPIFRLTGFVSGHTLKHVLAGAAAGLVLVVLARRRPDTKEVR